MMSESLESAANPFASANVQLALNTEQDGPNNDTTAGDVSPIAGTERLSHPVSSVNDVALLEMGGGREQERMTGSSSFMCMNSAYPLTDVQAKLDSIRQWSISTYKCTRQALNEKLGKSQKTVDIEVDQSIESLKELQKRYATLIGLVRTFLTFFQNMIASQRQLADSFEELSHREPELREEFKNNAECQRTMLKNGEALISAIQFFMSNIRTLCDKTMEDTLITVRNYETARLEYDAYRCDLGSLQSSASQGSGGDTTVMQIRVHEAEQNCEEHKKRYEKLRSDVQIKIRFLEENRIKVVQKQLLLFHNATAAYFSGNQSGLEAALKQFSIKPKSPNITAPSFLEQS